jgi:hypothetical protein
MSSQNLDNLVKTGGLKKEPYNEQEYTGLLQSGEKRLNDAENLSLSHESRFDLGYNAAHALALAALRWNGYRSNNRYLVFQTLPYTLNLGPEVWRVLAKCHECRNLSEYEGYLEVSELLLNDLLLSARKLHSSCLLLNRI